MLHTTDPPDRTAPPVPTPRRVGRTRAIVRAALAVVVVVAVGVVVARFVVERFQPHLYAGTVLQASEPAPDLDGLTLTSGEAADLAAYAGDVVLLYFGYTNCPDVCPTTLADVARAKTELGDDGDRVHLVMVSVDPERDDMASLGTYLEFFHADFQGAGGPVGAIDRVAAQYGVYYALGEGTVDEGYTVDHTGSLMGIDPDGALRVLWAPDTGAEALRDDLKDLLS